ncbi:hypothetical protein FA13DRAFT_1655421 [Coprinellus micaceus]|uniref:CBM1 domain-containing protein n=1 Tax=Coprinellus micaceus TaxID=71717 RepID=A0A4Y7U0D1_COPMI|nr:hypothetical protein FA13DRAFT_1655421 [Coprinellus micaceus]
MLGLSWILLSVLAATGARAGEVVWDGSFNNFASAADFDKWSWGNQVGSYQWYIHGSQPTSRYLNPGAEYKNPAHTSEQRGLKMTIDTTATWNSQMQRAELIPQTTANLGTGNLFYHFSLKRTTTNAPDTTLEHQVMFFESHFTELKYGVGNNGGNLVWMIGGQEKWSTTFSPDTWYNFAYDINFDSKTVGLWASTNGSPLTRVANNQAANTFTDSRDFHVGVLRIVNRDPPEDWYISGVYIEKGPITTALGNGTTPGTTTVITTAPTTPTAPTTTVVAPTTPAGPQQTAWGQCGGTGWTGPTACTPPQVCKEVAPPFYSQCQ